MKRREKKDTLNGTQLEQRHAEKTCGGEHRDHCCFSTSSFPDLGHIHSGLEPHPSPLQESSTCGWLMGDGPQSSGGGGSKLVVTESKSPSRGCRWLLVSNCYKHWVSGAVRNASKYSAPLICTIKTIKHGRNVARADYKSTSLLSSKWQLNKDELCRGWVGIGPFWG